MIIGQVVNFTGNIEYRNKIDMFQQQLFCEKTPTEMEQPFQVKTNTSSESQISEASEKSDRSLVQNAAKKINEIKVVSRKEIEQMNERVKNQLQRNRKNYETLISLNPYFSMKLFAPQNTFGSDQCNSTSINLMLKQLDMLLDDGHLLEKQIKKTELRKMQSDYNKNYEMDYSKHHYAHIRKIWLNPNEGEAKKSIDRIEQLNKRVAFVKSNLFTLIDIEKKSYEGTRNDDQYETVVRKIGEVVQETKQYCILKEKYQNLRMAFEDIEQRFGELQLKMDQKLFQKNEIITKLKHENDDYKRIAKQSKQKLLNSELKQAKLLLRIKQLQINNKDKISQNLKLTNELSNTTSKIIPVINIEDIKFRKIQVNQVSIIERHQQKQEKQQIQIKQPNISLQPLKLIDSTQYHGSVATQADTSMTSQQNFNYLNKQRNHDFSDLKSIDGKRGRFSRMRSPCGGRLNKQKAEEKPTTKRQIGSPKLNEIKENEGKNLVTSQG